MLEGPECVFGGRVFICTVLKVQLTWVNGIVIKDPWSFFIYLFIGYNKGKDLGLPRVIRPSVSGDFNVLVRPEKRVFYMF